MKINKAFIKYLIVYLIFLPFVFLLVMSKNIGHIIVALFYNIKPYIHYSSVGFDCLKDFEVNLAIAIGGVFFVLLIAIVAFVIFINRRKGKNNDLSFLDFCLLSIISFWLRPLLLMGAYLLNKLFPNIKFIITEVTLSSMLNLPEYIVLLILGSISIIFFYKVLHFINKKDLKLLILSGGLGAISGYFLWIKIVGPIILP